MTKSTTHTPQQVIEAIVGTGGIKSTIARRLDVSRWTVDNYLKRWKSVQEAYDEEREKIVDMAETKLLEKIKSGDYPAIRFFLMTQAKERGYVERQEVAHTVEQELMNLLKGNQLTTKDRAALAALFPDMSLPREGIEA